MGRDLKIGLYRICRALGLFAVSRRLTGGQLRILCYHGVSFEDEHRYAPGLFMRPETIRARFDHLRRQGYPVLPLSEACQRLKAGTLPRAAVAITYDDGFYGNYAFHGRLHEETGLPATLYVTTYYVVKGTPIFRHAVRYMFWKSTRTEVNLEGIPGTDDGALAMADRERADAVIWALIRHAEEHLDEPGRVALSRALGERLGMDYDAMARSRRLSLMTPEEIREAADRGLDIQLHTHRHMFPSDETIVRREIADNREVLESILGRSCDHLCYPSGVFDRDQWPWMESCGIASGTTCERGFNDAQTPLYGLKRFLDAETVQPIEFEAEVSGFAELLRRTSRRFRRRPSPVGSPTNHGH